MSDNVEFDLYYYIVDQAPTESQFSIKESKHGSKGEDKQNIGYYKMRVGLNTPNKDRIKKVVFSIPELNASVTKNIKDANEDPEFDIAAYQDKLKVIATVHMVDGSVNSKDILTKAG